MITYINYDDYKKYTKCKEIVHDVIKVTLLNNNIESFHIYSEYDKFARHTKNAYPFEFKIDVENNIMSSDDIRNLIIEYFKEYKKCCSKIKISKEEALSRYENNRIEAIEKIVRERHKDNSFKLKIAIICYSEHITTIGILKGLYSKADFKTDFEKWFKDFSKKYPNFSFKTDKEIDNILVHDKEVLKHIKFMDDQGVEYSKHYSNYECHKMN